jgi:hypothetical protein
MLSMSEVAGACGWPTCGLDYASVSFRVYHTETVENVKTQVFLSSCFAGLADHLPAIHVISTWHECIPYIK